MVRILLLVCFSLLGHTAFCGGFQITLQGVRQQGMGHTGVSVLHGASCLFFNPGAITLHKTKLLVSGSVNFVRGDAVYYDPFSDYTARTENIISTPFSFYTAYRLHPRISAGIAVYTPFGSRLEWEPGWKGRFLVSKVDLQTIYYQPTLSFKLTENLGLGASLVIGTSRIGLEKDIPITSAWGTRSFAAVEGHSTSMGTNCGLFWKISERLNAGISYRSGLRFRYDNGTAIFTVPSEVRDSFPPDNTFDARLNTPSVLNIGASLNITSKLVVSAEVNFTQWSVLKSIPVDFKQNTSTLRDVDQVKNYHDTRTYRLGLQYTPMGSLAVRAGIAYDRTPVDASYYSPETPDSDRLILSAGFSFDLNEHFTADGAYTLVEGRPVQGRYTPDQFSGVYKFRANVLSLGLSYTF